MIEMKTTLKAYDEPSILVNEVCPNYSYCKVRKFEGGSCFVLNQLSKCKLYQQYEDVVNSLFVGSVDKQTIEKLFQEDMRDY